MTSYAELLGKVIEITEDGTQLALTPAQIIERLRDRDRQLESNAQDMRSAAAALVHPINADAITDTLWMPGNCASTIFDHLGGDIDAAHAAADEYRETDAETLANARDAAAYAAIFVRSDHCADDRCRGAEYPCGDCISATRAAQMRAETAADPAAPACDCSCAECGAPEHPADRSTCGAPAAMVLRRDNNSPGWNYCDGCGTECLESGLYQRDDDGSES